MQPCGRRLLGAGTAQPPPPPGLGSASVHSMDRAQRAHMARALGVTTTVLFVASVSYIALTALYACFCDGGRRRRDGAPGSSSVRPEPSEETKRALDGIPVHVVQMPRDGGGADEETSSTDEEGGGDCAVCLAEYAAGDKVRVLPTCGHGFHMECVDRWLLTRAPTCPVCRAPVVARVEGPDDAKEDYCGDGDGVERRGGGVIGLLPVAGESGVLPAIDFAMSTHQL